MKVAKMSKLSLGFVGLGRMGLPMLRNLLAAGYHVNVYDVSAEALDAATSIGAVSAASPKAVADAADIVLACLPSPAIVRDALTGENSVASGIRRRLVIDLSTTGPRVSAEIADILTKQGIGFVDSPVSGGVAGAVKGTLTLMVSCQSNILDEVLPILNHIGQTFHVGEKPGLGQTLKLVNNILNVAAMAISSEAMVMGVKAGLDPRVMTDVINRSSGRNSATQDKFPKHIIPRTFDFGFSTGLAYKDVRLCVEEAEVLGVPMLVGGAVKQFMMVANAACGPDSDFTRMVELVEDWAGVQVKGQS